MTHEMGMFNERYLARTLI